MSKTYAKIVAFNTILKETLAWLNTRFSNDPKLQYIKTKVDMAVDLTPRLTVLEFMNNMEPYMTQIHQRDDKFFLNMLADSPETSAFNLGDKWSSLDTSERDHLWQTVTKLITLGTAATQ